MLELVPYVDLMLAGSLALAAIAVSVSWVPKPMPHPMDRWAPWAMAFGVLGVGIILWTQPFKTFVIGDG